MLRAASARGVKLAVFPEFCLTGYTCGDLFLQRTLQQGALDRPADASGRQRGQLDVVALVGLPLLVRGKLYNCAAVLLPRPAAGPCRPRRICPITASSTKSASSPLAPTESRRPSQSAASRCPLADLAAFPLPRDAQPSCWAWKLCEDLWSALPAFHRPRAGRSHRHCESLRQRRGGRQGGVPPGTGEHNQSARLLCGYAVCLRRAR